jgi:putative methionine-R-sulfoxide reductase with GAF domain
LQDAQDEIDMIIGNLDADSKAPESYRIVSQDTLQEIDLYQ